MSQPHRNPLLERFRLEAEGIDKTSVAYRRSKKQEKELAQRLGARLISGSGNGVRKGDLAVRGIIRIEAKTTQRKSFIVTREMVEIISNAAAGMDETPAIVIEFLDANGKPECEVAIVPTSFLKVIVNGQG